MWIKSFNRLVSNYTTRKKYFCFACFSSFISQSQLYKHKEICQIFKPSIVILPNESTNILKYHEYDKQILIPFKIYADFECLLKPSEKQISKKMFEYQSHDPISFCIVVIQNNKKIFDFKYYRGIDAMKQFFSKLKSIEYEIMKIFYDEKPLIMTDRDQQEFTKTLDCYFCQKPLNSDKVRDHCHISGKYRGAAHRNCNLQAKQSFKIPLMIHNAKNYDAHFIIRNIPEYFKKCDIIPRNTEQYLAFKLDRIQFLDSYAFIDQSLVQMTENLMNDNYEFPFVMEIFKKLIANDPSRKKLLLRKGVFHLITSIILINLK